jgi:hypothetical protein
MSRIILTCGSGITAVDVVYGILKFARWVRELVLVSTGFDRRDYILKCVRRLEDPAIDVPLNRLVTYVSLRDVTSFRYEAKCPTIHGAIELHPLYEGKTFQWAANAGLLDPCALFWITGGPDALDSTAGRARASNDYEN